MNHMSRFFSFMVALLMVFYPLTSTHQASAMPQNSLDMRSAYMDDAEIYAANMGISIEEARYHLHMQDVAGNLEAKLTRNEAETFAGLWIEHSPKFQIVVLFTRNPEQKIRPYITKNIASLLNVRTANVSLENLRRTQKQANITMRDLKIPVESEINIYENNVEFFVAESNAPKMESALQSDMLPFSEHVKINFIQKLGNTEAVIYGGLPLSACNTGFAVQNSTLDVRGITTAGHCSNSLKYSGKSLTFEKELYTGSYDVQWHTPPGFTVTNKIQVSSNGTTRNITATKHRTNQVVGGYVCKYGSVTGYTCGYISSKTFCGAVSSCAATFIRVDNTAGYDDLSSSGDSGSPWFTSNTAYGIHHGAPGSDSNDAIYMAVNYVGGLGVSVLTSP